MVSERGTSVVETTARLGVGNTVAGVAIALLSLLLGAVAGAGAGKKRFLFFFAALVGLAQGGIQALSRSYFGKLSYKFRSGNLFKKTRLLTPRLPDMYIIFIIYTRVTQSANG